MKLLIILMFFFGILLVIQGIYDEKILTLKNNYKIQYRFVPRSYYDEQLFSNQFSSKLTNIFDEDQDEWSANQRIFTPYNIDKIDSPSKMNDKIIGGTGGNGIAKNADDNLLDKLEKNNDKKIDNEETDDEETDDEETDNEETDDEETDNEETDDEETDNEETDDE